jgi:hypothetical protein
MISELEDDKILEFLMTSDLDENFKTEEYKYLILKFRSFYKMLYGKHSLYKTNTEIQIRNLTADVDKLNKEIVKTQIERADSENKLEQATLPRKLTWKERWSGVTNKF